MILRRGMSGDAVKRVQGFLGGLKLYLGALDGLFGGGVESAVKTYQIQQGVASTGLVDPATWTRMFPNEAEPASEIASRPLAERCLALTGSFETGTYPPDCFCRVTGDFDQMGISFGVLQWNLGSSTLQPLLAAMFTQHEAVARNVFHEHFDTVAALHTSPLDEQLTFARSVQTRGMVQEPWHGMLTSLGRTPEFQGIQTADAKQRFDSGLQMCRDFGLTSERAVALMFDIVTQNNSIATTTRAQILADFKQLPANDPGNEVAKMCIVANRRANAADPRFADDVRTRKLAIANGTGTVHGIFYDLQDMFGIGMDPYEKALAAAQ